MANLKIGDESKASLYSFSSTYKTEQEAIDELAGRGWTKEAARSHLDAALRSGAFTTTASLKAAAEKSEGK